MSRSPVWIMDSLTTEQLMVIAETIYTERLEHTKLQAALVWVAADGKLDKVGKPKHLDTTQIEKLKAAGILEVE